MRNSEAGWKILKGIDPASKHLQAISPGKHDRKNSSWRASASEGWRITNKLGGMHWTSLLMGFPTT